MSDCRAFSPLEPKETGQRECGCGFQLETQSSAKQKREINYQPAVLAGKVSAQPHTIVKQICFPNGNVLFLSLFSLFKN